MHKATALVNKQQNNNKTTRSTGTVHTSAKARLTNAAIDLDPYPDRHQNLIIANLPQNFHANPFRSFCEDKQTDRQTMTITYPPWRR